jgi:hypothetical protein
VKVSGGVKDDVVRTVLENAGTLRFRVKGLGRERGKAPP